MGWKIVRNSNEFYLKEHVSGQWRTSPDPIGALVKKLGEEYGEFAENRDPGELYDLLDVLHELIELLDPDMKTEKIHREKFAKMGGFSAHREWHPNPDLNLWETWGS